MALPTYKTLVTLRDELAVRLGRGGMVSASHNQALLDSFLQQAQVNLFERMEQYQLVDTADKRAPANSILMAYPDELDPNRIFDLRVDYSNTGHWYPMRQGIDYSHDSALNRPATWQASAEYQLGDVVVPTTDNGYKYIVTTAGTSGGSEPTWDTDAATPGTTSDGTVTWTTYAIETLSSWPRRYEFLSDGIELWPRTDRGYTIRFEGIIRLGSFSADSDVCTLPDNLVLAQALIYAKSHYRHPDVQPYVEDLRKLLRNYRGRQHGNNRYIPRERGSGPKTEKIRPKLVS